MRRALYFLAGATWYQAHASAAKAAIDSLTRTLGLEWGAFGIRVTGVAPGPIGKGLSLKSGPRLLHSPRTLCYGFFIPVTAAAPLCFVCLAGTAGMAKLAPSEDSSKFSDQIPVGYMGEKWDIAMACVYLSSTAGK
jgi:peroxisomal 2,4-dienoyl-CoA reductase